MRWIRWRIGDGFSVWHRLGGDERHGKDVPRASSPYVDAPTGVVVLPEDDDASLMLRGPLLGLAIATMGGRARCGAAVPVRAEVEVAHHALGAERCVICLRLALSSSLPPAGAAGEAPRGPRGGERRKRGSDARPAARA